MVSEKSMILYSNVYGKLLCLPFSLPLSYSASHMLTFCASLGHMQGVREEVRIEYHEYYELHSALWSPLVDLSQCRSPMHLHRLPKVN